MFKWFRGSGDGLADVEERFLGMLEDGRHLFDLAMSARVAGADPTSVAGDVKATEERTDEAEREIRRRLLVHASVHGTADLSACLMYMSIAKDAERVSDLAKGLFEVAEAVAPPSGPLLEDLIDLRDRISPMITEAARIFADDDKDAAEDFIARARDIQSRCNARIAELVREDADLPQPAASAVSFRHLSRIMANLLNIVSAVVVPLDRLDYPTEDEED